MTRQPSQLVRIVAALSAAIWTAPSDQLAEAFVVGSRWTATASGDVGYNGDPITLTWSIAPDAAPIPDRQASTLVAFMDAQLGAGSGGSDLTARPWFPLVESAFSRWSELGSVRFIYEPSDDGAPVFATDGAFGGRGDVRLAGSLADGPGGTLASSHYPNTGDIVLDVEEGFRFGDSEQNYVRLRNALMHEIGHALGLDHVVSSDAKFLMESTLDVTFDGPQLDEIRGLHYLYGDRLERSELGNRNDSLATATPLGLLNAGAAFALGVDAGDDPRIEAAEVDFLSISNRSDVDYFRFETNGPTLLNVQLTPRGGSFRQAEIGRSEILIDARSSNDLSLELLDASGMPLIVANNNSRGAGEEIANFSLPASGVYFLRVSGWREAVQLYELRGGLVGIHAPEPAGMEWAAALIGALPVSRRDSKRKIAARAALERE